MNIFQTRLRQLREESQISSRVLSELCGLNQEAIRRYERGERTPSLDALQKIADHFDVSLDYLTGRSDIR